MKSREWFQLVKHGYAQNHMFNEIVLTSVLEGCADHIIEFYIDAYIDYVVAYLVRERVLGYRRSTVESYDISDLGYEMRVINQYQNEWHDNHDNFVALILWKARRQEEEEQALREFEENEPWDYPEPVLDSDLTFPVNRNAK